VDLKGKVWVADFFFTRCPTICPVMTNNLQDVQEAFLGNENLKILSFTCDPEYDRPEQLSNYAAAFAADTKQWQFVTGEKSSLYRFARNELSITATDGDGGETDFIHEQYLVLVDKDGFIRGFYDGTKPYEVKLLIRDIKKLL
jgi:protein SCO1